jgi:hypothetical protein
VSLMLPTWLRSGVPRPNNTSIRDGTTICFIVPLESQTICSVFFRSVNHFRWGARFRSPSEFTCSDLTGIPNDIRAYCDSTWVPKKEHHQIRLLL